MKVEKLVVGNSVESLLYATQHNHHILYKQKKPLFFEWLPRNIQIQPLINNKVKLITNSLEQEWRGSLHKSTLVQNLYFVLSISGLLFNQFHSDLFLTSDNTIKNGELEIGFEELVVFDNHRVRGITYNEITPQDNMVTVIDLLKQTKYSHHEYDLLRFDGQFPTEIQFYGPDITKPTTNKHAITLSKVKFNDLKRDEFSNNAIGIGLNQTLIDLGLKRKKYFPYRRIVQHSIPEYESYDNVKFRYDSLEDLSKTPMHPEHEEYIRRFLWQ